MASERAPMPIKPALQGIADALRLVIPLPEHDAEERDERRLLRRHDVEEAVRR